MSKTTNEQILKEFRDGFYGYSSFRKDYARPLRIIEGEQSVLDIEDFISQKLDQVREEERKEIREQFVKEFCTDHNGEIRWLRGVAMDTNDLLSMILLFFNSLKEGKE